MQDVGLGRALGNLCKEAGGAGGALQVCVQRKEAEVKRSLGFVEEVGQGRGLGYACGGFMEIVRGY